LKSPPAPAPAAALHLSTWTYAQACEEGLTVGGVGWSAGCSIIVKHLPPPAPAPPKLPSPVVRPLPALASSSPFPFSSSSSSASLPFGYPSYKPLPNPVPASPFATQSFGHQQTAPAMSFKQFMEQQQQQLLQQQQQQQAFSPFPPPNPFSPSFLTGRTPAPWPLPSRWLHPSC
jgi:hypothetical protein